MGRIALKELQDLVACMRASGVTRLRDGDLEIDLAEAPSTTPTDPRHDGTAWPEGDGDVYTSEFSYARGVPHLKRFTP